MKKLTAIFLSVLMVVSLTACGGVSENADKKEGAQPPVENSNFSSTVNNEPDDSFNISQRLTKAQLIEAYQTIEDINLRDRSKLTYEKVVADYMNGVEGEIDVSGEGYVSYIWKAQEDDDAQVNFIFQLDEDDGVWGMGSRSIDNME